MPNYSMDNDPDFWQAPDQFKHLLDLAKTIGTRGSWFALGDPNDENTPMAVVLDMKPGYVITRHCHPCARLEVIVRGTLDTGDKVLTPGDIMYSGAHEFYGPKVAGPEGCTTLEVFATVAGASYRIIEEEDGSITSTNLVTDFETAFKHLLPAKTA
jgi:anti-sigma factor ChrR (cupin superfamily)